MKKTATLLLLGLSLFTGRVWADLNVDLPPATETPKDKDYDKLDSACDSLAIPACGSATTYNDGTGVFKSIPFNKVNQLSANAAVKINTALNSSTLFRRLSLEASRPKLSAKCKDASLPLSRACFDEVKTVTTTTLVESALGIKQPKANSWLQATYNFLMNDVARELRTMIKRDFLASSENYVNQNEAEILLEKLKAAMGGRLMRTTMPREKLKKILKKLYSVKFDRNSCNNWNLAMMANFTAFYEQSQNSISICAGAFQKDMSQFSLAMVIGHELAHSFGPSFYDYEQPKATPTQFEQEHPFANVLACLRTNPLFKSKRLAASRSPYNLDRTITRKQYLFAASYYDQSNEMLGDWLAAEVLPGFQAVNYPSMTQVEKRRAYINVARIFCGIKERNKLHPEGRKRIEFFTVNPKIRESMGCAPSPAHKPYCDSNTPPPAAAKASQPKAAPQPTTK